MSRISIIIVVCAIAVAVAAGAVCSALQGSDIPGAGLFGFVTGMVAIVSGGCGIMIPAAWAVDRFSAAGRRHRSFL